MWVLTTFEQVDRTLSFVARDDELDDDDERLRQRGTFSAVGHVTSSPTARALELACS